MITTGLVSRTAEKVQVYSRSRVLSPALPQIVPAKIAQGCKNLTRLTKTDYSRHDSIQPQLSLTVVMSNSDFFFLIGGQHRVGSQSCRFMCCGRCCNWRCFFCCYCTNGYLTPAS